MTPEMALKIDKIEGNDDFEIFVNHFKTFSNILNLFISEKMSVPMTPMLKMYAQISEYFESCMIDNSWNQTLSDDYLDGMRWVFTECCPEGFIFDGKGYCEDG